LRSFLRLFLASFLAMVVLLVMVIGVVALKVSSKSDIEDDSYLVVDIYGDITEYDLPGDIFDEVLGGDAETLQRILDSLEKAAVDDRIKGVIMKLSSSNTAGRAMLQEIRGAVKKVQKNGKVVLCYADSMDRDIYYLAAACDSIFMPPGAYFSFMGMLTASTHVKKTLDKLGVNPNLHRIKEYKSAAELVTRENLSEFARENRAWLLDERWDMFTRALEEDRGLTEEKIVELMEHALFLPGEAMEGGLVDRLLYWDELEGMLKQEGEDELHTVTQSRYSEEDPEDLDLGGDKKIAVIHAQGTIAGRESGIDPILGVVMGHESVAADLRKACEDEDVAGIVFRVDSGGGDGLTSDLIGHQVEVAAAVKPVVASMVDVAASGGYAISYRASKIVADPMTVAGSIGSISGKFNLKGLYDMLGVTHDHVEKGPMAMFFSSDRDFTEKEWERFIDDHWKGFDVWMKDIAKHRNMTVEELEQLAYGRVFSGRQAKENGLVDEVGGLDRAVEIVKELAGIPADENVTLVHYPEERDVIDEIFGDGDDALAAARWLVYRYIKNDLAETWDLVMREPRLLLGGPDFE